MSDPDCIFCKIIAGDLPSTIVDEDERTLAFMDIAPATRGHALVVPRAHSADLLEVDRDDLCAVAARNALAVDVVHAGAEVRGDDAKVIVGRRRGSELLQDLHELREASFELVLDRRIVDVFVCKLREKVDRRAPRHSFVHTRYGVGYKLEAQPKSFGA